MLSLYCLHTYRHECCVCLHLDPVGCGVIPPKFDIILTPQTWPESHQHCMLISDELFSPSNETEQMEMVDFLNSEGLNERLWIGLRRSLLTLEWYRQKGKEVHNMTYTSWVTGEPRAAVEGMCASVFPNSSTGFNWKSVPCCAQLKSICYSSTHYFPLDLPSNENANNSNSSNSNSNSNSNA